MTFSNPSALFLLALIPLIAMFLLWRDRQRAIRLQKVGDSPLIQMLITQKKTLTRVTEGIFWLLTVTMLVIALARPVWGIDAEVVETQGISVMFLLDVSRSMDAEDIEPSRLERAKLDLRDMITALSGNEVGLILFAGTAYMYLPSTTDTNAALSFVNTVNTNAITRQGTAMDRALEIAIGSFSNRTGVQPIIVIISDGENLEGEPLQSAQQAAEQGIIIHAIGYGTNEGSAIPIYNEFGNLDSYQSDAGGNLVISKLDETILTAITEMAGGVYRHAGNADLPELMTNIYETETGLLNNRVVTRPVERFGIFVALAILFLSLEMLLPLFSRKTNDVA